MFYTIQDIETESPEARITANGANSSLTGKTKQDLRYKFIGTTYGAEKYSTHRVILITNCASKCGVFSRFNNCYRPFKTGVMTFYKFGVTLAKLMFTKNKISLAIHCQETLGTW